MAVTPTSNKTWWKSKTVWFNILTIGGAVLSGLGGVLPSLAPVVSVQVYQWVLFGVGFGNVLLRSITTGPIDWNEDVKSD